MRFTSIHLLLAQPVGFVVKGQENKVCKLNRSIYGLKQSSRQWYFKDHIIVIDEDHCVYVKRSNKKFVILFLYVDNILLARNDK